MQPMNSCSEKRSEPEQFNAKSELTNKYQKWEIEALQEMSKNIDMVTIEQNVMEHEQIPAPIYHTFGPGVYMRQIQAWDGSFLVGHTHRFPVQNIFLQGSILAFDGGDVGRMDAPMVFTTPPGRKMGLVLRDMVWINVFPTDMTDVFEIECLYIDKSDPWWEALGQTLYTPHDHGFAQMLEDLGVTADQVWEDTIRESNQCPLPYGTYKCQTALSPIHGKGMFASAPIEEGEFIGLARVGNNRTPIGRFVNHSDWPTAYMDDAGQVFALQNMEGAVGGMLQDEILMDYRDNYRRTKI